MLFLSKTLTSSGFVCKEVIFVDSSKVICSTVSPQIHCNSYKITAFFPPCFLLLCEVYAYVLTRWTVRHVLDVY